MDYDFLIVSKIFCFLTHFFIYHETKIGLKFLSLSRMLCTQTIELFLCFFTVDCVLLENDVNVFDFSNEIRRRQFRSSSLCAVLRLTLEVHSHICKFLSKLIVIPLNQYKYYFFMSSWEPFNFHLVKRFRQKLHRPRNA